MTTPHATSGQMGGTVPDAKVIVTTVRFFGGAVAVTLVALLVLACVPREADQFDTESNVVVNVTQERIELGRAARLFEDPDRALTVEGLLAGADAVSSRRAAEMNNLGFVDAPRWFLVTLENPEPRPVKRMLVFDPSWLDDIQVALVGADGSREDRRGGDHFRGDSNGTGYRKANFVFDVPPGRSRLVVRIETSGPCVVGMRLWERGAFFIAENAESLYVGTIYGIFGAMLLFNLVLWRSVREGLYAAWVAYLLSFMLAYATYNGFLNHYLWPDSPRLSDWINSTTIYCYTATGLLFALQFLQLRPRMGGLDRFGRLLLAGILVTWLVTSVTGSFGWSDASLVWLIACAPFMLLLGVVSLAAGMPAARYYLPATACGLMGATITALTVSGLLPFTFLTWHAVELGMVADAVLISFALAQRVRRAHAAAEQARVELLEATTRHAQQLEQEVEARTRELRESNAAKDRFFSIIAHDLRGPIKGLGMLFTDVVRAPDDFDQEVLDLTRATTFNTGELLEQLLTWARNQRGEVEYAPHMIDLADLLAETQRFYTGEAGAKRVALQLELGAPCRVYADGTMVKTILRNLVGNAIKFTPAGGRIEAVAAELGSLCAVHIRDTGQGITAEEQPLLFEPFESPTRVRGRGGLGLLLCREFVERHGGTLRVESSPGTGTRFSFTLPRAAPAVGGPAQRAIARA